MSIGFPDINLDALAGLERVARMADPNWSPPNVSAPPLVVGSDPISQAVANSTYFPGFTGRENLTDNAARPTGGGSGSAAPATPAPTYNRAPARGLLANLLRQFGLESMLGEIESFIEDFGANDEFSLAERIRGSQGYKDRFKGLVNLRNKGITDIQNEADYLRLETEYRQAFRDAGIQSYLGEAGSVAERDAIADLAGKYSVSVNEVRSRINDAQRVVQRTDPNTIDALRRFYNIAPSDLVAYTLDPTRTSSRINQLANAAIVGGMAADAGLQVGRGAAEQFSSLMGDNDLSADYTLNQLGRAREVRDSTARLASIEESTLSDDETLLAEANLDQEAKRRIRGLQSRERARFGGAGAFRTGSLTTPTT